VLNVLKIFDSEVTPNIIIKILYDSNNCVSHFWLFTLRTSSVIQCLSQKLQNSVSESGSSFVLIHSVWETPEKLRPIWRATLNVWTHNSGLKYLLGVPLSLWPEDRVLSRKRSVDSILNTRRRTKSQKWTIPT
jgi:hypothetical protein